MPPAKCITFAETVQGRDASVRVIENGMIWAIDLAVVVTGKPRGEASLAIRRIPEVFPASKMIIRSLPGKGNAFTKLVTFQDSIELVMVLPGKVARETRTQFAGIIQRYMAGISRSLPRSNPTRNPPRRSPSSPGLLLVRAQSTSSSTSASWISSNLRRARSSSN